MKKYLINYKLVALFLMIGVLIGFIGQCGNQTKTLVPNGKYITSGLRMHKKLSEAYKAYNKEFTSKEEYYIGRSLAASLLQNNDIYGNGKSPLENYVSKIGYTLAMASALPETYQGYRFIVLRSQAINAFAVPSG